MGNTFWRVVLACAIAISLACAFSPAKAEATTGSSKAFVTIPDKGKSRFMQGMAMTDNERYAYCYKQNGSKYGTLWRVDTKTKKVRRMTLGKGVAAKCRHANGMSYAYVNGQSYLLVAPSAGSRYIVVLKVKGTKATYYKSIRCDFVRKVSMVAVKSVQGSKVVIYAGCNGNNLYTTSFDMRTTKVISSATFVKGYAYCQDISYYRTSRGEEYVYGVNGGWYSKYATVTKYRIAYDFDLQCYKLVRVWSKSIAGEAESSAVRNGRLYIALEGNTYYRKKHGGQFKDRLVVWNP